MSSQASWQTGGAGWGEGSPDQQSVEDLLRRLLLQVEETERRYSEALDQLQGRLDQLALNTDAARAFGAAGDAPALDRLHDQVSGLARRFEREASTSLDDFERLGRAVMVGLDRGATGLASNPSATSFPSPFTSEPPNTGGAASTFSAPELGPLFPPFPPLPEADRDLSRRLIEMAHRLEVSVDAAMAPKSLDDLHARIDAVGRQITDALTTLPKPVSLEPLERQIAYIGHKLGYAETELAKIGEIEIALHRLIERIDNQASQLGDVAAKAATEAARLVSGEAKLDAATAARLDTMHRDLTAMNAQSIAADDRIAGIIEAVHESLKQLVQQAELSAPRATALRPYATLSERILDTHGEQEESGQAGPPQATPLEPRPIEVRPPFGRAKRAGSGEKAVDLDERSPAVRDATRGSRSLVRKTARTESEMEDDLVAAARRAAQAAARKAAERDGGRHKWAATGAQASSRIETPRVGAPRAEMPSIEMPRTEMRHVEMRRVETPRAAETHRPEALLRRGRPLLIVSAAVLLVLSAILLYSRLQTKPWPEFLPPAVEESAPLSGAGDKAPATAEPKSETPKSETPESETPKSETPPEPSPSPVAPDAASNDARDAASRIPESENVTDIAKSSYWPATVMEEPVQAAPEADVEVTPQAAPAALNEVEPPVLPPGVVFTVEDPSRSF